MQDPQFVRSAFSRIAKRYVLANHILSGGIDVLWRRRVAARVAAAKPNRVLDVATGSGDLAAVIRWRCPGAQVIGGDFCAPMMVHARRRGLPQLLVADGLALPFADGTFDVVTVGFGLRNMASYPQAVEEWSRVLRPGGRLLILDFSLPENLLRGPYRWYLHRILPRLAGWLTGERGAYEYLGGSIEAFPAGKKMIALLTANGFVRATAWPQSFGIASIYEAVRAG